MWGCKNTSKNLILEWSKRSLYGGVYPVRYRPKVKVPRNPWNYKWNLRWKKGGELWKLCLKFWKRNPWRICRWEGKGVHIVFDDGYKEIFMGEISIDHYVPISRNGIDIFL